MQDDWNPINNCENFPNTNQDDYTQLQLIDIKTH